MRRTLILQHRNGYTDSKNVITSVSENHKFISILQGTLLVIPDYMLHSVVLQRSKCLSIYSSEGINMY